MFVEVEGTHTHTCTQLLSAGDFDASCSGSAAADDETAAAGTGAAAAAAAVAVAVRGAALDAASGRLSAEVDGQRALADVLVRVRPPVHSLSLSIHACSHTRVRTRTQTHCLPSPPLLFPPPLQLHPHGSNDVLRLWLDGCAYELRWRRPVWSKQAGPVSASARAGGYRSGKLYFTSNGVHVSKKCRIA
jgi:hypothetical protein